MLYIPFEEILTTLRRALEKAGFDEMCIRDSTTIDAAEKLAVMYILRDHIQKEDASTQHDVHTKEQTTQLQSKDSPEARGYSAASRSEFRDACRDVDVNRLIDVMDEHMSAMKLLYPKEYDAIIKQLKIVH